MKKLLCQAVSGILVLGICLGSLTGCISSFAMAGEPEVPAPDDLTASPEQPIPYESDTEQAELPAKDPSGIRIGVWDYNKAISVTEEGAKSLVDFGADLVMHPAASYDSPNREAQYKWFTQYGIETFGVKHNLPYSTLSKQSLELIREYRNGAYFNLAEDFVESSCEIGDYLYDEIAPKTEAFLILRRIVQLYEEQLPGRLPLINLTPCYWADNTGANLNLDFDSYRDYVEMYCRMFPTLDYICYDVYPFYDFGTPGDPLNPYYLHTLDTVAAACRKYGKEHWIILQAGTKNADHLITDTQLRVQVYTALAFGATTLVYANYSCSWWVNKTSLWYTTSKNTGYKTYLWDFGQTINREVRAISDAFMRYEIIDTCSAGTASDADMARELTEQNASAAERGFTIDSVEGFWGIETDGAVLVGSFAEKNGGDSRAMMLVNVTDPFDETITNTVSFSAEEGKTVTAYIAGVATVLTAENGVYTISLSSGNGVFVTVE